MFFSDCYDYAVFLISFAWFDLELSLLSLHFLRISSLLVALYDRGRCVCPIVQRLLFLWAALISFIFAWFILAAFVTWIIIRRFLYTLDSITSKREKYRFTT